MESEFFNDLKDLEVAFKSHVDEKDDERSIIVIGEDGGKVHVYMYGKSYILGDSLLNAMKGCDDRALMNAVVYMYEKEVVSAREAWLLVVSLLLKIFVVLWAIGVIALWWFCDMSGTLTISNLALIVYTFFYICVTSMPYVRKMRKDFEFRMRGKKQD